MATTTTKSKTARTTSSTAKQTTQKKNNEVSDPKTTSTRQYRVKKNLDPNMIVTVKNGFQGSLVYISSRTNEKFVWEQFGDEQDMDLQELKNARNSSKGFFENNWFLIDDPEVIEYLGVEKYYENALRYDDFDNIFTLSPDEIKYRISLLSRGQKRSVAYRAKQLIAEQKIDSIRVINTLEDSLSTELIER